MFKFESKRSIMKQHIKKLAIFLFPFLTALFWISSASATKVYIPQINAASGRPISIPVIIDKVDNLAGVRLVLEYNPKVLTYKKAGKSKKAASLMHIVNAKKPGKIIAVMAGARGIKGKKITIITFVFEIKNPLKNNPEPGLTLTDVQLMSDKLKKIKCSTTVAPLVITPVDPAAQVIKN